MGLPSYDPISRKWIIFEPYVPPELRDPSKEAYQAWGFADPLFTTTDPSGKITYRTYAPPSTPIQDALFIGALALGAYIVFKKLI